MALAALTTAQLNRRVEIRRAAQIDDGKGGYTAGPWKMIAKPFVSIEGFAPKKGSEEVQNGALTSTAEYRIRMWYREDLLTSDQVRHAGADLNITAMFDPFGNRRELTVLASADAAIPTS